MEFLESIISTLSSIIWGPPMLILLVGTGIYLTIILKGMQFWALPHALKLIFHKEHNGEGEISHFAALMTALAATVGIGNIVGVATAITLGGPGAVFCTLKQFSRLNTDKKGIMATKVVQCTT